MAFLWTSKQFRAGTYTLLSVLASFYIWEDEVLLITEIY